MFLLIQRFAVAIAILSVVTASADLPPDAADSRVAMGTLEAEAFRIDLPLAWEEQDLSNQTIISPTPKDVRAHFRRPDPDGEGAAVLFQYTAEPAIHEPPSPVALGEEIEEVRAGMADLPPEDFRYYVQDKGHGCLDGFQLLSSPETIPESGQTGHHIAFDYEYGCYNGGYPVRGWAWVAYSPDGRKHNIFMTAREDVWIEDFQTLQAVTGSLTLPE